MFLLFRNYAALESFLNLMPILMDFLKRTSKLSYFLYHPFYIFFTCCYFFYIVFPNTLFDFSLSLFFSFFFCRSTKELFLKFLQRLETDYIPREFEGNLIKDVSTTLNSNDQELYMDVQT